MESLLLNRRFAHYNGFYPLISRSSEHGGEETPFSSIDTTRKNFCRSLPATLTLEWRSNSYDEQRQREMGSSQSMSHEEFGGIDEALTILMAWSKKTTPHMSASRGGEDKDRSSCSASSLQNFSFNTHENLITHYYATETLFWWIPRMVYHFSMVSPSSASVLPSTARRPSCALFALKLYKKSYFFSARLNSFLLVSSCVFHLSLGGVPREQRQSQQSPFCRTTPKVSDQHSAEYDHDKTQFSSERQQSRQIIEMNKQDSTDSSSDEDNDLKTSEGEVELKMSIINQFMDWWSDFTVWIAGKLKVIFSKIKECIGWCIEKAKELFHDFAFIN
ncbi:hypothetical protein PROFUN_14516 [Planoprotostelium fungivorum]|uniref:Uncharacterized protein n=1 Tax=Planoprotostelium fungivorum TaxID=1890364 RepID=A0A2P6MZP9_9EUKA|nr:hypothetical protein PROFUN_14516 [Planoprotostelium fungivorum]